MWILEVSRLWGFTLIAYGEVPGSAKSGVLGFRRKGSSLGYQVSGVLANIWGFTIDKAPVNHKSWNQQLGALRKAEHRRAQQAGAAIQRVSS